MAYTNSTPNYDLPQWIGSDKPDFLGDLDPAFLKIDETMKNNETSATGAESVANAANTKADNAVSTANSAIAQIGAVDTKADNAISTANNAQTTANTANGTANAASESASNAQNTANTALANTTKFNLTNTGDITFSITAGTGTINSSAMRFAVDASKTVGKIYGVLTTTITGANGTVTIKSSAPIFAPVQEKINIICVGTSQRRSDMQLTNANMIINTDGTIELTWYQGPSQLISQTVIYPCLYFAENFGDQPIEPSFYTIG